jgi:hypothetical protein
MEEVAAPRPWQGPRPKKQKGALGEYGKSLGGGALFQRMFRAPTQRVLKTKVFRKSRSYTRRGTAKGHYSKANIALRKQQAKDAREAKKAAKILAAMNAPKKRSYTRRVKKIKLD